MMKRKLLADPLERIAAIADEETLSNESAMEHCATQYKQDEEEGR